ncbi:unnamed protein product [Soboliphyme baturini]|uniref:Pex2_Pex12 domain-containing protein n=1 Tax=Soboliphyme baturini TaxID=241478 RepID=A0A183J0Q8_9BILA|nr:unnamed protein product [Soboliphyme baturini]
MATDGELTDTGEVNIFDIVNLDSFERSLRNGIEWICQEYRLPKEQYFLQFYSLWCTLSEMAKLLMKLGFLCTLTKHHSLASFLSNTKLTFNVDRESRQALQRQEKGSAWNIRRSLATLVGIGVLFIQFLDYWRENKEKFDGRYKCPVPRPPHGVSIITSAS